MYDKKRLISLIREHALTYGDVKLASGKISTYYIDLSKVVMLNEGLQQIVWGLGLMPGWSGIDAVGGPAMGAIPLVSATMLDAWIKRSFFVRKEIKEYGRHDLIEGNLQKGDRVMMLEDVTTTGGSLYKAIQAVEKAGGVVKHVYSVLDREEGAKDFFLEKNYTFSSLLTVSEILS